MSEWWTYRPSDFLMFSGRTWDRLVAAYNADLGPVQPLLLLAAIALAALAWRPPRGPAHVAWGLAGLWALVGWAFLWQRYAGIDTSGPWLAAAWWAEAALLAGLGWRAGPPLAQPWRMGGLALALGAIALPPVAAGGLARAATAGSMPGPTALLTIGLLLVLPVRHRRWLLVLPLLALAHAAGLALLLH